ncbi:DUF4352 domain-containing protein [Oceanobacillus rekensis]|uniref:DUF4352 domain-containing protein n=1 Tax=Oceanobacillus rekensis TaxID=937927 RepID=UPI000B446B62|nr:DUF4352 domain-containing protein [Oceanobacillus rekensis]
MAREKVKKPFYKKWWVWLIAIIVVIAVTGGGDEETATTEAEADSKETTTSGEAEKQGETEETEKEFSVGEEVAVEDFTYTVNGVEEVTELEMEYMDSLTTEGKFVVVDLTIANNDKEARFVDSEMFRLIGTDETEFSSNTEADMYVNDDIGFFLTEINPKMSSTGKVVFELPAEETGYTLQVSSGFGWSGGEYANIDLGK